VASRAYCADEINENNVMGEMKKTMKNMSSNDNERRMKMTIESQ
jgi:hypothetical protein